MARPVFNERHGTGVIGGSIGWITVAFASRRPFAKSMETKSKPSPTVAKKNFRTFSALLAIPLLASGCAEPVQTAALGAAAVTAVGGVSPSNELEQIYYIGSFDPQGQLPPTMYRIRVHGQASALSSMRFASGWVPARFIDSLNSQVTFSGDKGTATSVGGGSEQMQSLLNLQRRMVQFGPEGFMEAPADHRLVVIMGSNPDAYFNALDSAIGSVSSLQRSQAQSGLTQLLLTEIQRVNQEQARLNDLTLDMKSSSGGN